jgi:hypothetical protein
MAEDWVELTWDSEFLGLGIGKVDLAGKGPEALQAIDAEARAAGISCLYGHLDPSEFQATYEVQRSGYRLVEASARFDLHPKLEVAYPPTDAVLRRGTAEDLDAVTPIMVRMAPWSRFAVDPRFGLEVAERMNRAWIERAARCETGEFELVVAEEDGAISAFISRALHPYPIVDTVATIAPGSGAARALIQASRTWAGDRPLWGGWAAMRNINSFRFVEHCGFRTAEVRYLYHRWLDEPVGA